MKKYLLIWLGFIAISLVGTQSCKTSGYQKKSYPSGSGFAIQADTAKIEGRKIRREDICQK